MTESEAKGFIHGKLDCMNECGVFNREDIKKKDLCDNCEYCYSQGNFGQQKEAFQMAINALKKQIAKKPIFQFNLSDTVSRFECKCGNIIKVRHDIGIMDNSDAPKFCDNCGQKLDWSDEE